MDKKRPATEIPDHLCFDVTIDQYSFRNASALASEREKTGYDVTIHRRNSSSSFTQTAMTRAEIAFTIDRLQAFLEDTAQDNNIVYTMECGHEHDSPYRLTRRSRGHCSQHGFQRLLDDGSMFLPTWRLWAKDIRRIYIDVRESLASNR